MSFQRILDWARRESVPVIVTDVAGREPMVILPFSEYERLTERQKGESIRDRPSVSGAFVPVAPVYAPVPEPIRPVEPVFRPSPPPPVSSVKEPVMVPVEAAQESSPEPKKSPPSLESVLETISVAPVSDVMLETVEDRFYLDSSGDQSKK